MINFNLDVYKRQELNETDITVKGSSKPITILYEEKRENNWVKLNTCLLYTSGSGGMSYFTFTYNPSTATLN